MTAYRRLVTSISLIILVVSFLVGFASPAKSEQLTKFPPILYESLLPQTQEISSTETLLDVAITDEGMFPPALWITPGTTIRWTNQTTQTQHLEGTRTAFIPDADAGTSSGGSTILYFPLIFKGNSDSQGSGQVNNNNNLVSPDTTWQSGDLLPGESFERTFGESGAYPYHLTDSPTLSGTIIIPNAQRTSSLSVIAVNTTADDNIVNGNCTLREAIIAANKDMAVDACQAGSGADSILLGSGTYALTLTGSGEDAAFKGDLDITKYSDITIVGANDGSTVIDASQLSDRVFHILSCGKLNLSNVTVKGGKGSGGGIYNVGTLTLNNSSVLSNTASGSFGGGLKNEGTATVNGSTFSGNSADYGGGIYNRGILALTNSTISGNTAKTYGGGVKNEGTLKLNNVTVSANTTSNKGGGILNYSYGKTYYKNTIIVGNTAPNTTLADCDYLSSTSQSFYSQGYNLVGDNTGCPSNGSGDQKVNPAEIFTKVLGSLQNNGGNTFTQALLPGSPAIDAGDPNGCKDSSGNLLTIDQRGELRPVDGNNDTIVRCDIGAYEAKQTDTSQTSPYIINIGTDTNDGSCTLGNCSLREAINAANTHPNGSTPDEIRFSIPISGLQTILLTSTLTISDPLIIDGTTQPGASCSNPPNLLIKLDGTNAGPNADGLNITGGGTTVRGLIISGFRGNGIQISGNGNNIIRCNTITANGGDGVRVADSTGNVIGGTGLPADVNYIFDNTGLGIDLGGDGVTLNDLNDSDVGPNNGQNFPVLTRAIPNGSSTNLEGRLNSSANTTFNLEFFANETCDPASYGEGKTFLGAISATTNISGNISFATSFPSAIPEGQFVAVTATDPNGNTSEFSQCVQVNLDNDTWPRALRLDNVLSADQYLDKLGQSRWYKFTVTPNSRVIVTLTNLPANYDLTIYKDISAAFASDLASLGQSDTLLRLGAEFAAGARSPDEFAAGARSPDAFAAGARSPDAFAVGNFSPDVFAAGARSPDAFAAGARSPDAFAAGARSPDVFAPDAFAPDAFAAGARSEDDIAAGARSEDFYQAFASAQTRSLIGFSAFEGTASEGIILNTWNNSGDFYVRVRGRDGAFSQAQKFHLAVTLSGNVCSNVNAQNLPATSLTSNTDGQRQTIILADLTRLPGTPVQDLEAFSNRDEVKGVVVNVGADARVAAANKLADENTSCPYAKNLVAEAIKAVVDRYRAANPLAYIVIVGNDNVIPFFRYPDSADLGPESDYVPPVFDLTASQASLKLNYVLNQDAYGSKIDLSFNVNQFPVPDLPVGRLVETPSEISRMLAAYAQTNGVVTPNSALVTGYDFFADAAGAIKTQLEAGLAAGTQADALITPRDTSPLDVSSWTAAQLKSQLLGNRHDLIFLGGHFSAASALAADYQTRLVSADLVSSTVNLDNAVIFSIGCHSGYNIVNEDGIPFVTREPDWAQAFAQKGATLIAGTGYQYGDTDFIEYSERIYLEFARQLRTGDSPVAVGTALVKSKQKYLAETPEIRGLHEKALLISTLFGLPMLKVDMPRKEAAGSGFPSIGGTVGVVAENPGARLGLATANISIDTNIRSSTIPLTNVETPSSSVSVTVLKSLNLDGVERSLTNVGEPVLPLWLGTVPGDGSHVLRGVGFRGGNYSDSSGVRPLTGAPTTEIRGVHTAFFSNVFFPAQPWRVNYFDALTSGSGGTTLALMPAQFKTDDPIDGTNILRQFSNMQFRLYYSDNTSNSALAAAPAIVGISAIPDGDNVLFKVNAIGDPTVGVHDVWVTFTAIGGSSWQSLDLTQDTNDSTLWTGTLNLNGTPAQDVRYIVQAANGVGLVSLATNVGAYYIPGVTLGAGSPTSLSLELPGSGIYGAQASFSAVLKDNGGIPLANQIVIIGLGSQGRQAVTDSNGRATVTLPLLALPGENTVRAAFPGTVDNAPSSDTATFNIAKQNTVLVLNPQPASGPASKNILLTANLTDAAGQRLFEKTIFFEVSGASGTYREALITDYAGRALLGNLQLPPGIYTVKAYFNGTIPVGDNKSVTLDDARYNSAFVSGTLTLTAPQAQDDAYSTDEDTTLNVTAPGVLSNDTNADFSSLSAVLVSSPASGILTLNANGSFTYTPNANFNGSDSFTYKVNDGTLDSNVATVTITVNAVNDAPLANNESYNVNEDTVLNVPAPGVLGNDTDVEGDPLAALLVSSPAHGSLTLNTDGSFTYTPNANFNGSDSFTYKVNDGAADSNVATVAITINPVNDVPAAVNDSYSVNEDTILNVAVPGVLGNDTDVDGDSLTAVLVSSPANGALTLNANGSFTYTPNANFNGSDSFTYKVNDGTSDSNVATVTITVNAVNDAPLANNDTYTVTQKSTLVITAPGVLANDTDIDSSVLTAVLVSGPTKGSLTLNANGAFTYTPVYTFYGTDTFTYKANDGLTNSNIATVTINVKPLNRPPDCSQATAKPISFWPPNKDTFILENVIGVTDPDGDPLTINITKIFQDERTGTGKYGQDGYILGPNSVKLRAERDGNGDGRVYHVFYTAHDDKGEYCEDSHGGHEIEIKAGIVPHDQENNLGAVDQGAKYDSTVAK